jgi:hypothetical protein
MASDESRDEVLGLILGYLLNPEACLVKPEALLKHL